MTVVSLRKTASGEQVVKGELASFPPFPRARTQDSRIVCIIVKSVCRSPMTSRSSACSNVSAMNLR